jgi:hypothetical protein
MDDIKKAKQENLSFLASLLATVFAALVAGVYLSRADIQLIREVKQDQSSKTEFHATFERAVR